MGKPGTPSGSQSRRGLALSCLKLMPQIFREWSPSTLEGMLVVEDQPETPRPAVPWPPKVG